MNAQTFEQPQLITEEKYIQPLVEVLDKVTPTTNVLPKKPLGESPTLRESLDNLFPEQKYEEKNIQEAQKILGDVSLEFSQDQLKEVITEAKFLIDSWLDDFEREIFQGLTLQELLHEKGGA